MDTKFIIEIVIWAICLIFGIWLTIYVFKKLKIKPVWKIIIAIVILCAIGWDIFTIIDKLK